MDFDLKSNIEDDSVSGLQPNMLLLILGLAALFIIPSIFMALLLIIMPNADPNLLNYLAMFLGYGTYIAILLFYLGKEKSLKILKGFNVNNLIVAVIFTIILFLVSQLMSSIVSLIFGEVNSNANQNTLNSDMATYPLVVSILTVIFAPIAEELVFRFTIFRPLAKKNKIIAYLVTVLSFAGVHFISSMSQLILDLEELSSAEAYGRFFDDLKTMPIYIGAALVLTISYDVNKNIATNIMIHSFYNLINVFIILYLISSQEYINEVSMSLFNFDFLKICMFG